MELSEHLFRHEAGRLVAALTRVFGVHNLALAEDVVQDALCRALEVWKFRGVPENPSAWLLATAKRRALDVLRRERTARKFDPELGWMLESEWTLSPAMDELLEPAAIQDDQLRMMFSCCHPRLGEEAQVGLILQLLCGFGVADIAAAFLDSEAATQRRLVRAKRVLARSGKLFALTDAAPLLERLPTVRRALYLLFNHGYHGPGAEEVVQRDLCQEAMRLAALLVEHPRAGDPTTHALAALMCLHAARLPARLNAAGELTSLFDQDRTLWDQGLIAEGNRLLELSAQGPELSEFHLEAAIAAVHADARRVEDTCWPEIVMLYDRLLQMHGSPVVALNRAIALGQSEGAERGLAAIAAIDDRERLREYPFYFAALGELERRCGRVDQARDYLRAAIAVARSPMERRYFEGRMP
jgi:RNA polymerase sigma-70 factor (ECF subfamily)